MTPKHDTRPTKSNIQWIKCGLQNIPFCHIQITQQSAQSTQNDKENLLSCVKRERKEAHFRASTVMSAKAAQQLHLLLLCSTCIQKTSERNFIFEHIIHICAMSLASFPNCMANTLVFVRGPLSCAFFAQIGQIFGLHFLFVRALPHQTSTKNTQNTNISYKIVYSQTNVLAISAFHMYENIHTQPHKQRDIHVCSCSLHNCLILFYYLCLPVSSHFLLGISFSPTMPMLFTMCI